MNRKRLTDLITVKISPATRDTIEELARARRCAMAEVVRGYIEEGLRRESELSS